MAKILICVGAFEPSNVLGGMAIVAADHAFALAGRGHEVTVLTTNLASLRPAKKLPHGESLCRGVVRVHALDAQLWYPHFSAVRVPALSGWLQAHSHRFDLFHIHFARDHLSFGVAQHAIVTGKPVALQTHGNFHRNQFPHRLFDRMFTQPLLHGATAVLALQDVERRQLLSMAPRARIQIMPNGIPLPAVASDWSEQRLAGRIRIVFIGRLSAVKRVMDLIEAAKLLCDRGLDVDCEIVGPDEGELKPAQMRIEILGLIARVRFTGALSRADTLARLRAASVYVQPSVWESFSLTTLEALALGIPAIITTGNEFAQRYAQAGVTTVIEPGPEAIARAVQALIARPQAAAEQSQKGMQWVRAHFSIERVAKELEAVYAGMLSSYGSQT